MSGHAGRLPGCTNAFHDRHQMAFIIFLFTFALMDVLNATLNILYVVITFQNMIFGYIFDVESRQSPSNDVRTYYIER